MNPTMMPIQRSVRDGRVAFSRDDGTDDTVLGVCDDGGDGERVDGIFVLAKSDFCVCFVDGDLIGVCRFVVCGGSGGLLFGLCQSVGNGNGN